MQKKLIVFLVSLLFLVFAGFFALPMLINKDAVKNQVIASFKLLTGLDLLIQGQADLQSFPFPHMVIHDVYVPNIPTASTPFLLTVKTIDVRPTFSSLLKGGLVIGSLNATGVNVELEHLKDGGMNWRDTTLQTPAKGVTPQSADAIFNASSITISNATLHFTDSGDNTVTEYKNINLSLVNGGNSDESSLSLNVDYKDKPFVIAGRIGNLEKGLTQGVVPAHVSIGSKNSHFMYDGDVSYKNAHYMFKGSASLDTDDVVPWILLLSSRGDKPIASDAKPLPLKAKTDITTEGEKILFKNLTLDGSVIKGGGEAVFTAPYKADIQANIASLDLETFFNSALFAAEDKASAPAPAPSDANASMNEAASPKSLWNMVTLDADIKVADTTYNQQHIKNTHFSFDMESGEINIPQASALLPGDSRLVFTGIGREGYQGITLEGQIDAAGTNFTEMIKVFKSKGFAIPAEDFKRFRIKTNAVISPKEARFSELAVRIENMGFVGGVVATFGERTKLQTALRIGGLNLDHFSTLWGLKMWESAFLSDTPGSTKDEFLSHWLKQLGFDLEINASIEQYILNGKLSQKTDMQVVAVPGKISIPQFKAFYNGSTLTGSLLFDVTGQLPRVDMDIVADVMDTSLFFGTERTMRNMAPHAQAGEYWSHKGFDFHLLDFLNSNYHLKIGRFRDDMFEATNLDMKGNITNRTLTADSFSGETLGAKFDGKGVLVGGKIPGISLAANIQDLNANRLPPMLPVLMGMSGKYNLNFRVETAGIDMFTWVSNLNGTIGIAGRDIVVHGFNLPGIVKAVSYVRTVANILNVVKRAFPGGDTVFSRVEGRWTIVGGIATAADMHLTNPDSDALLTCDADLVNWKMKGQISFPLKSLDASNPPSMLLNIVGNLDMPEKALDTRMLEQYVTNKTSEKMLQEYGH